MPFKVLLFLGIGYFTLPLLVHAKAKLVHACEWNENAVEALRENLINNKVSDRCVVHPGDNRKVTTMFLYMFTGVRLLRK